MEGLDVLTTEAEGDRQDGNEARDLDLGAEAMLRCLDLWKAVSGF